MKKNLIAAGVLWIIVGFMVMIQLAIEYLKPHAGRLWLSLVGISVIVLMLLLGIHFANARDNGQWGNEDAAKREWYRSLMQPDVPTLSCCGEADAYWCDDYYARGDKAFCRITDDRPDAPRNRPHIDVGTEFEIPPNKLKWDASNPTGHAIIFLSKAGYVWCFVQGTGI